VTTLNQHLNEKGLTISGLAPLRLKGTLRRDDTLGVDESYLSPLKSSLKTPIKSSMQSPSHLTAKVSINAPLEEKEIKDAFKYNKVLKDKKKEWNLSITKRKKHYLK